MKRPLSSQLPSRWLSSITAVGLCLSSALIFTHNEVASAQESSEESSGGSAASNDSEKSSPTLEKKSEGEKSGAKSSITLIGAAQTLPERVLRARYVFRDVTGNSGFDNDGNKVEGLDAVIHGQALALEYGLTPKISLQLLGQLISTNDVVLDASKFRSNPLFKNNKAAFIGRTIPGLISAGLCTDTADCQTKIANGLRAPLDVPVTLPTGETFTIPAGSRFDDVGDSLVLNGARPLEGKTGIGDTTVGALFNLFSDPSQMFSLGVGVRLPTGEYSVPGAYRGTGAGFTTLGVLFAYDYRVAPWFLITATNQSEYHLTKIKRKRSSIIDNSQFNTATPTDGIPNEETYERKGLLHTPGINFKISAGGFVSALKPLTADLFYGQNIDSEFYLGGRSEGPASKLSRVAYTLTWDGLNMEPRLPFFVSVQREVPLDGVNQRIAAASTFYTTTLYYRF